MFERHTYQVIRCDKRGCRAAFPSPTDDMTLAQTRRAARIEGWATTGHGLDLCPRHKVR